MGHRDFFDDNHFYSIMLSHKMDILNLSLTKSLIEILGLIKSAGHNLNINVNIRSGSSSS